MQSNAELTVEPGSCRMHVRYNASAELQRVQTRVPAKPAQLDSSFVSFSVR